MKLLSFRLIARTRVATGLTIVLVACGGQIEGGIDASGASPQTPPVEVAPAPTKAPPPPVPHEVTHTAPPPSALPACSGTSTGTCSLFLLVENTGGDDGTLPDGAAVALAVGLSDATSVALDGAYAYAADRNRGVVARVPIAGGPAESVASGANCERIEVDAANVYCRTPYSIVRFLKAGAPTVNLATPTTMSSFNMVLSDATIIFDDADTLKLVPVTGGAVTTVNGTVPHVAALGAFGNVAYVVNETQIWRVPLDGSASRIITLDGFYVSAGALVDASGVYWVDRRWTCLRESVRDPDPAVYGDLGERICKDARNEIRVVRAPLTF
jgi:hypothetical protein